MQKTRDGVSEGLKRLEGEKGKDQRTAGKVSVVRFHQKDGTLRKI